MSPIAVILTIAGYFALLLAISAIASCGGDNDTFFTGNRRAPWPVVAFAMIGAAISGVTFISVPGMVVGKGHAYLQMALGFIAGYVVIAFVLVPLFYRRGLVSIYGYLDQRFGRQSYRTGAWIFFVSKITGASVRFFVVCAVLQLLVFRPLGIPFELNVLVTVGLIWLYTVNGGVKALIWTDLLKSFCLIASVVLCIVFVADNLGLGAGELVSAVKNHPSSQVFFFDNPKSGSWFWKQFVAGVFMAIATNGLDQDMMQRHLACRDSLSSRKNMIFSGVMQFFVIALFLVLGTLLVIYAEKTNLTLPEKTDELFSMIATHPSMPLYVGIVFVTGLIAAAYSAAGSALTSLTTSFTVDILNGKERYGAEKLKRVRRGVHVLMSGLMAIVIVAFYRLSSDDAISAVYTLASYTYGPILGLFVYGMICKHPVNDRLVPAVCIAAPLLAWGITRLLWHIWAYETGFELLILNALLTMLGLHLTSSTQRKKKDYVAQSV